MPFDNLIPQVRTIAINAAREELLPRFAEVSRRFKADGSLVTAADMAMQTRMQIELAEHWPQYDFLGEETPAEEQERILAKTEGPGLWCLDPLDGTSNFVNGIPFFSTSLALVIKGEPVAAWIYDPIRDECFTARQGRGAWLNDIAMPHLSECPALRRCMAAVDLKRLGPRLGGKLGQSPPYGSQRSFGSSALEWCWLAASRLHIYLHGAQKLWDYAAGTLILSEAGGYAQTLEGATVFSSRLEPRSVVAARNKELFDAWKSWIEANS
ncbi:MAG TPA: inositol monophosphatase [Acidiferrobacterales bacterium]|nr:inositol monophosphatase [Acidiferrobacterales bacterium]